jgi:cell wall-associated NlpC family hydrolase
MKMIYMGLWSALVGLGGLLSTAPAVVGETLDSVTDGPTQLASYPAYQSVPVSMLTLYLEAASVCPGMSWTVLAAVGTVESANGTSDAPGVHSGRNRAGAEGPMQFEPATFRAYSLPVPPGGANPPSPYDPVDAVYAAARMLCADGANTPSGLGASLFDYNHSEAYVAQVLAVANSYGRTQGQDRTDLAWQAIGYALSQVGTPYRWGGEAPGVGFDCSGLVQAAWASAGVALPRVAQAQYEAGPLVLPADRLLPGDLVFFGTSAGAVGHVGIFLGEFAGQYEMVDAPHTGADVRIDSFPDRPGARWGNELFVGATRPALLGVSSPQEGGG